MAYNERVDLIEERLNDQIDDGILYGAGISGNVDGTDYSFVSGYADLEKTKKFDENTILRQMSDTKLMGVVAFLKLVENGRLNGHEPLEQFIPEFHDTKVIHPI